VAEYRDKRQRCDAEAQRQKAEHSIARHSALYDDEARAPHKRDRDQECIGPYAVHVRPRGAIRRGYPHPCPHRSRWRARARLG